MSEEGERVIWWRVGVRRESDMVECRGGKNEEKRRVKCMSDAGGKRWRSRKEREIEIRMESELKK